MSRTVIQSRASRPSIVARALAAALLALLCGATLDRAVAQPSIAPFYGVGSGVDNAPPSSPTLDHRLQDDSSAAAAESSAIVIVVASDGVATNTPELQARALMGGQLDRNPEVLDQWGSLAAEQRYTRDSVAVGTTIVDGLALECTTEISAPHGAVEIVVTAHLEEEFPQADRDSAVLWIDVLATSSVGSPMVCTTLAVRAGELMRLSPCESFDRYQEATLAFDMRDCRAASDAARRGGSDAPAHTSIRVRYAGNATVAIRSIAVRPAHALPASDSAADGK